MKVDLVKEEEKLNPHCHYWNITLSSLPVSKRDYHLVFLECSCGVQIAIGKEIVSVGLNGSREYIKIPDCREVK